MWEFSMVLLPRVGWGIIFDMITYLLVSFFYYESVNKWYNIFIYNEYHYLWIMSFTFAWTTNVVIVGGSCS